MENANENFEIIEQNTEPIEEDTKPDEKLTDFITHEDMGDDESASGTGSFSDASEKDNGNAEPSDMNIGENYEIPEDIFPAVDPDAIATVFSIDNDDTLTADADTDISDSNQIEYDIFDNSSKEEDSENQESYPEGLTEDTPKKKDNGYNPDKPRRIDSAFDIVELLVFSLVAVLILTTFFFRHSVVSGPSMESTLHNGEHLIISDLFYTPKRGDIIVCEDYSTNLGKPIVKRIIGIGGDRIRITVLGDVYVNDVLLDENYIKDEVSYINNPIDIVVPEGELFVMGDNRNNSTDSRQIGTITENSVLGRVLFRFYPFDKFGKV